ncbi:hypothetical protein PT276_08010 [Orbaceae bacterium ESL0721]|nr:hypothetical protein [Orbaceae bacterium ESL0721]
MKNQKIIKRLRDKPGWKIEVKTDHEFALAVNACIDACISWNCKGTGRGRFSQSYKPIQYPFYVKLFSVILIPEAMGGGCRIPSCKNYENITEWFFKELNKPEGSK